MYMSNEFHPARIETSSHFINNLFQFTVCYMSFGFVSSLPIHLSLIINLTNKVVNKTVDIMRDGHRLWIQKASNSFGYSACACRDFNRSLSSLEMQILMMRLR